MAYQNWTVLCDFDGTIALTDVIDSLLERFGQPGWRELEQDWLAGRIGSRQCMQQQVALLQMSRDELDAHLDSIQIDPAFPAFLEQAASLGLPVGVVSDGMDYAIHRILRRHGIEGLSVAANQLAPAATAGRWLLTSPFEAAGCRSGTCKCAQIRLATPGSQQRALLIGDGTSDFCAAERADFIFAKAKLRDHCKAKALPYRAISGFAEVISLLPQFQEWALQA